MRERWLDRPWPSIQRQRLEDESKDKWSSRVGQWVSVGHVTHITTSWISSTVVSVCKGNVFVATFAGMFFFWDRKCCQSLRVAVSCITGNHYYPPAKGPGLKILLSRFLLNEGGSAGLIVIAFLLFSTPRIIMFCPAPLTSNAVYEIHECSLNGLLEFFETHSNSTIPFKFNSILTSFQYVE
jgi:hypothetical protein